MDNTRFCQPAANGSQLAPAGHQERHVDFLRSKHDAIHSICGDKKNQQEQNDAFHVPKLRRVDDQKKFFLIISQRGVKVSTKQKKSRTAQCGFLQMAVE
jgi:hypothetical protein